MHAAQADRSLENTLEWAIDKMRRKGFVVKSPVTLSVDPKLVMMGYAKKEGRSHRIVISEWALDSEMLGGLILHELAHIYFTERGAHSHDGELLEEVLRSLKEHEGLRVKETELLIDAFNRLQNILVDDIVFAVMDEKELETTKRFFAEFVSDRPSGDPVLDAALLTRNAFAVASLRRRGLFERKSDLRFGNRGFSSALGQQAEVEYEWLEGFLENSKPDWDKKQFLASIGEYFERILGLMRSSAQFDDLR
jgi:transposase-like protein